MSPSISLPLLLSLALFIRLPPSLSLRSIVDINRWARGGVRARPRLYVYIHLTVGEQYICARGDLCIHI